jgi:hypothetical protein
VIAVWLVLAVALLDAVLVKNFGLDPILVILYRGVVRLLKNAIDLVRDIKITKESTPPGRTRDGDVRP